MKKNITTVLAIGMVLSLSTVAYAQTGRVGVNTADPKSTMDINGQKDGSGNLLTTDMTGLQAPRLTRAVLTAKGDALYGTDQKGTLVYITDVAGGDNTSQRVNVTEAGYYYFDGTVWVKVGSGSGGNNAAEPWRVQNTTTDATANTQDIYQQGKVAVGFTDADAVSGKQFEVKGTMKAAAAAGDYESLFETTEGTIASMTQQKGSDVANSGSFLNPNYFYVDLNNGGSNTEENLFQLQRTETTNNINTPGTKTQTYAGPQSIFFDIQKNGGNKTVMTLDTEANGGVRFDIANGTDLASYYLPRTNGTPGQVLMTDGVAPTPTTSAQLYWGTPAASGGAEPWKIQNTTTDATANTQNIYQQGKVAIGFTDANAVSDKQLDVAGTFRSVQPDAGGSTRKTILETNSALFPMDDENIVMGTIDPATGIGSSAYVSPNASGMSLNLDGTRGRGLAIGEDGVNIYSGNGNNEANSHYNPNNTSIYLEAKNNTTKTKSFISMQGDIGNLGLNGENPAVDYETRLLIDQSVNESMTLQSADNSGDGSFTSHKNYSAVHIEKGKGIAFHHDDAAGNALGYYVFPQNNGAAGQVLTTNGSYGGQLYWADPAASKDWHTAGNDDIVEGTDFLGTTTDTPLDFRVNNEKAGHLSNGAIGNVSFGYKPWRARWAAFRELLIILQSVLMPYLIM